jgi:hypothetical protein
MEKNNKLYFSKKTFLKLDGFTIITSSHSVRSYKEEEISVEATGLVYTDNIKFNYHRKKT